VLYDYMLLFARALGRGFGTGSIVFIIDALSSSKYYKKHPPIKGTRAKALSLATLIITIIYFIQMLILTKEQIENYFIYMLIATFTIYLFFKNMLNKKKSKTQHISNPKESDDIKQRLKKLEDLKAEGLITDEEYISKRGQIIDSMQSI
jgi:Ca2+/Na+ antiporter